MIIVVRIKRHIAEPKAFGKNQETGGTPLHHDEAGNSQDYVYKRVTKFRALIVTVNNLGFFLAETVPPHKHLYGSSTNLKRTLGESLQLSSSHKTLRSGKHWSKH